MGKISLPLYGGREFAINEERSCHEYVTQIGRKKKTPIRNSRHIYPGGSEHDKYNKQGEKIYQGKERLRHGVYRR